MRNLERRRRILRQPVVRHLVAVVDPGTFGIEPLPLDAVEMQHRGVGGETRPDRRARIGFRPVDDVGEVLPERLFGKRCGDRLGAGDDQSVDLQAVEIGDIGVLPVDPPLARSAIASPTAARSSGNRCGCCRRPAFSSRMNWRSVACSAAVRHVVDEPDREVAHRHVADDRTCPSRRSCVGARPGLTISRRLSNRTVMSGPSADLFRGLEPLMARAGVPRAPDRYPR